MGIRKERSREGDVTAKIITNLESKLLSFMFARKKKTKEGLASLQQQILLGSEAG